MPYNPKELMKKILAGSEYRLKGSVKGRVRVAGRNGAIVNFTAADFGVQSLSDKIALSGEQFERFRARIFGILNAGGDEISNRITTGLTPKKRYRDAAETAQRVYEGSDRAEGLNLKTRAEYLDESEHADELALNLEARGAAIGRYDSGWITEDYAASWDDGLADDAYAFGEDACEASGDLCAQNFNGGSSAADLRAEYDEQNLAGASAFDERDFEHTDLYGYEGQGFCDEKRDFDKSRASAAPQSGSFLARDETEDLKFAPQKTAQIPILRGDGAGYDDMVLNLAINFEQNYKDSDRARSKVTPLQDTQTARRQNSSSTREFPSGAQEARGGVQKIPSDMRKIASGEQGIFRDARGVLGGAQEGFGYEKNLAPRIEISTAEGFEPQTKAPQGTAACEQSEKFDAARVGDERLAKPTQIVPVERLPKPARAASLGRLAKPAQIDDERLIKPIEAAEDGRSVELPENVEDERLIFVQTAEDEQFVGAAENLTSAASSLKPVRAKKAANFSLTGGAANSAASAPTQWRENSTLLSLAKRLASSSLPPAKPARPYVVPANRPAALGAAAIAELKPRFIGIAHKIKISFLKKSASEPGEGVLARVRIPLLMENFGLNDILSSKSNHQMAKKMVRTIADLYIAKDLRGVHIDVPVRLEMGFKSGISDVSNHAFIFKLVEDSLVNNGVIDDDNADIVREIKLFKQDVFDGVLVNIVRSE